LINLKYQGYICDEQILITQKKSGSTINFNFTWRTLHLQVASHSFCPFIILLIYLMVKNHSPMMGDLYDSPMLDLAHLQSTKPSKKRYQLLPLTLLVAEANQFSSKFIKFPNKHNITSPHSIACLVYKKNPNDTI
jgi:hypothetical protein